MRCLAALQSLQVKWSLCRVATPAHPFLPPSGSVPRVSGSARAPARSTWTPESSSGTPNTRRKYQLTSQATTSTPEGTLKLTSVTNSALHMQWNMSLECHHNFFRKFVTLASLKVPSGSRTWLIGASLELNRIS